MKTVKELKEEIVSIKHSLENDKMKKAAQTRMRKRLPFLKLCIMYLESNPDHKYMRAEIEKVETKINLRMIQFPLDQYQTDGVDKKTVNRLKKAHEKKYEVPHLREQVRTLRFLLKS